ncbi:MAG: 2'-5' RNA ligase family protein [Campylobacterota bacterium]|nr:2'-5' RNA ligase family protein [Campylobacterota bacterium]
MKRLFIGSYATIENYGGITSKLAPYFKGKWNKESNLHLTFRFLGNKSKKDMFSIIGKLRGIEYPRDHLISFDHFGLFGQKVLYLTDSSPILYQTKERIDSALEIVETNSQPYVPHITLMRIKEPVGNGYQECIESLDINCKLRLSVCLIESRLYSDGSRYTIIERF